MVEVIDLDVAEVVNTAVYNSAGAARPSVVVVVSDDDDDDKEDKKNGVDEYGINFNKPLLQQVPFLKEKYSSGRTSPNRPERTGRSRDFSRRIGWRRYRSRRGTSCF